MRTLDDLAARPRVLLTLEQVAALTGLTPSQVRAWSFQCRFPQPLQLGDGSQKWIKAEAFAWLLRQERQRDTSAEPKITPKQETRS